MKINIMHLYYDLLNLYGEQGNILALKNAFKNQNIDVNIDYLSIGDKKNYKKYDIIYIGSGSEDNLLIALDDLKKDKEQIEKYIKDNKYFIATGNSKELFGTFILMDNKKYETLGIFDYFAKENPTRIIGESFMEMQNVPTIIGFQNRSNVMQNNNNHLFGVLNGYADNYKSSYEGYKEYNFYGTYLIGPILIRNPHFTDYIVKDILTKKNISYNQKIDTYEHKAYKEFMKNFKF